MVISVITHDLQKNSQNLAGHESFHFTDEETYMNSSLSKPRKDWIW